MIRIARGLSSTFHRGHQSAMMVFPALCVMLLGASAFAAETDRIVARWTFDEGSGEVARDVSGHGRDGVIHGARYVPHGDGTALAFDGRGAHVDCGADPAFDLGESFTLEMWIKPSLEPEGSAIGTVMGKTLKDYALCYNPMHGGIYLFVARRNSQGGTRHGQWNHVVGVYDRGELRMYVNGEEIWHRRRTGVSPSMRTRSQARFTIGASPPEESNEEAGGRSFKGLIAEATVYGCALTPADVAARYANTNTTGLPDILAAHVAPLHTVSVDVRTQPLGELPAGASMLVQLLRGERVLMTERVDDLRARRLYDLDFDVRTLPDGPVSVAVAVTAPSGSPIGRRAVSEIAIERGSRFPAAVAEGERLNNLVTQLKDIADLPAAQNAVEFERTREGWTFVAIEADLGEGDAVELTGPGADGNATVWIAAQGGRPPEPWAGGDGTWEAMRYLPAGRHTLQVRRTGTPHIARLVIRAVPTLIYNHVGPSPHTSDGATRNPAYYAARGLRSCNGIVNATRAAVPADHRTFVAQWKAAGRHVYGNARLPYFSGDDPPLSVDDVVALWVDKYYTEELDGIVCDELHWRVQHAELYTRAAEVFHRRTGASVGIYTGDVFRYPAFAPFFRIAGESGGQLLWEKYFCDRPTTLSAWVFLQNVFAHKMREWREVMQDLEPDMVPRTCFNLGTMLRHQRRTQHIWPQADWNVFMDLVMHTIATDPAFDGTGGLSVWKTTYMTEEQVAWWGRLYRHYFVEGRCEMLSDRPYRLRHILNPGFEAGLETWSVAATQPGSVRAAVSPGLGTVLGLYPPITGDDVAVMTRHAERPNRLSQWVRNLVPGRPYTIRLIVADFKDIGRRQEHAFRVDVAGGAFLDGHRHRRLFTNETRTSWRYPEKRSAWMTLWEDVFRADGPEAELTVSDWAEPDAPGGPAGRQLMIAFVEVRPYFADPEDATTLEHKERTLP